jgi:hypothetical protein
MKKKPNLDFSSEMTIMKIELSYLKTKLSHMFVLEDNVFICCLFVISIELNLESNWDIKNPKTFNFIQD